MGGIVILLLIILDCSLSNCSHASLTITVTNWFCSLDAVLSCLFDYQTKPPMSIVAHFRKTGIASITKIIFINWLVQPARWMSTQPPTCCRKTTRQMRHISDMFGWTGIVYSSKPCEKTSAMQVTPRPITRRNRMPLLMRRKQKVPERCNISHDSIVD